MLYISGMNTFLSICLYTEWSAKSISVSMVMYVFILKKGVYLEIYSYDSSNSSENSWPGTKFILGYVTFFMNSDMQNNLSHIFMSTYEIRR